MYLLFYIYTDKNIRMLRKKGLKQGKKNPENLIQDCFVLKNKKIIIDAIIAPPIIVNKAELPNAL